jgi:hypothetical protein
MVHNKEWYEKEKPKKKEITVKFKLNLNHLKLAGYIVLVLALVSIIIMQHFGVIPVKNAVGAATSAIQEENTTEEKKAGVTIIKPSGNVTTQTDSNTSDEEDETEEEPEEDEPELLPITGEVLVIINKINYEVKGDDYARINSVKFTIKNQLKDFEPKIVAFLTQYGSDDEKEIELDELKAGEQITIDSPVLTFGYNNIDDDQILNLEVYDEDNRRIVKTSKTFSTN